jgi:hypothetical protein
MRASERGHRCGMSDLDPRAKAVADAVSDSLLRRGFLTTEWWTSIVGATLSTVLGAVGVPGGLTAQVVTILAPVLLAAIYALARTSQKSALAAVVASDLFPQLATGGDLSNRQDVTGQPDRPTKEEDHHE